MEPTIPVLFNTCYGGWHLSERALVLYRERQPSYSEDARFSMCRHDPILVQIFNELGREFDAAFSKTEVWNIPAKYINHYRIKEYDGMESVSIDYSKYTLDTLKEVLRAAELSSDEKVHRCQDILGV